MFKAQSWGRECAPFEDDSFWRANASAHPLRAAFFPASAFDKPTGFPLARMGCVNYTLNIPKARFGVTPPVRGAAYEIRNSIRVSCAPR
jgi:hypothetical protein